MKKLVILLVCLLAVQVVPAGEISLAVTRVEPIGVERDIARTVEELLQTEFAQVPIFQIVERNQLDAVLAEQELQLSGITSAATAARAGNVLNVQKVLFGSISLYESEYVKYLLSLRLVDVEKASVEAAETIQVRSKEALLPAIKEIVQRLSENVEIVGRVTRVDEGEVYTSLGEAAGVAPNAVLSVVQIELIKDEQGQVIMREENPVANLVVEKVSPEGSRCRVLASVAPLETGFTVRKGELALEREEGKSSLVVRSVPEGANVYLNSQFLGVTPMELGGLAPGKYEVEIRSGAGYKSYQGRITLGAGRTVTLERELERELEIEDLLLLGRVPRKPTDPRTAVTRSLLPGWGMIYNGYGSVAPFVPFTVIMPMAVGFASFGEAGMFGLADLKASAESGDAAATYNYFAVKNRWIENGMLFGWSFHSYATSIFDAWRTARQDFRYATYVELASGLSGVYTLRNQTVDAGSSVNPILTGAIYSGISSLGYGSFVDAIFEGRKYLLLVGLSFNLGEGGVFIDLGYFYRYLEWERLMIGLGFDYLINYITTYLPPSPTAEDLQAIPPDLFSPALLVSYKTQKFELDTFGSPYALARGDTFEIGGSEIVVINDVMTSMIGFRGRVDVRYFFSLKAGINLSVNYAYLVSIDKSLWVDNDISTVDRVQTLFIKAGVVLRF